MGSTTIAILAVSLLGALGEAAVTIRWYEPPATDEREPNVGFEAGLFFGVFGIAFALLGFLLAAVEGLAPPLSGYVLLALVPISGYAAYAAFTGRLDDRADRAQTRMAGISGLVLAAYPLVLLAL